MVEFDPGPPPEVAEHFAGVPSYAPHRDLFWYDWGPVFYRGRLDGSARVLCIASDPGPTERVAGRTLVGDAGQRVQGFLHKLGLSRSYACVNADASVGPFVQVLIGPALQAIVTFGLQARIAVEQWTDAPAVMIKKVPHPSSRDAAKLITEWRAAVADLRIVVTPDLGGDNSGRNYDGKFSESDYAPIPPGDLPFGLPSWLGDDSIGGPPSGSVLAGHDRRRRHRAAGTQPCRRTRASWTPGARAGRPHHRKIRPVSWMRFHPLA